MNKEPEIQEIADDENQPATKRDVREAVDDVRRDLLTEIEGTESRLTHEIGSMKEDIFRHFDVAVENIRHDLEGANADEISVIKDRQGQHDERISVREQRSGLV
jgi:hypothetical protein